MEYKSICGICGRQSSPKDKLLDHLEMKKSLGYLEVNLQYVDNNLNYKVKSMNFCPACAKKSYTIEGLKNIGNFNEWSY